MEETDKDSVSRVGASKERSGGGESGIGGGTPHGGGGGGESILLASIIWDRLRWRCIASDGDQRADIPVLPVKMEFDSSVVRALAPVEVLGSNTLEEVAEEDGFKSEVLVEADALQTDDQDARSRSERVSG